MRFLACSVVYLHVCIRTHMLISFIKGKVQLEDLLTILRKKGLNSLPLQKNNTLSGACYSKDRLRTATRNLEELSGKHMEEIKEVRTDIVKF